MMYRKKHGSNFWDCVDKFGGQDSCWNWLFSLQNSGYGKVWHRKRVMSTHRVAYELSYGHVPKGFHVLHRCDNKLCCNPKHLFLGTDADNMKDKVVKGRCTWGESNGGSKLTNKQRDEIRKLYSTGKWSQSKLGEIYGISQTRIGKVVNKRSISEMIALGMIDVQVQTHPT